MTDVFLHYSLNYKPEITQISELQIFSLYGINPHFFQNISCTITALNYVISIASCFFQFKVFLNFQLAILSHCIRISVIFISYTFYM